jgi:hypothetical protein
MGRQRLYNTEEERQARNKEWRKNNPDVVKAYTQKSRSKPEVAAKKKEYQNANKEKHKVLNTDARLKREYGIDLNRYNQMFEEQNGCCKICNQHQSNFSRAFAVDHCHATGKVRGLLCFKCNTALGKFNDDITLLKNAIKYLKNA